MKSRFNDFYNSIIKEDTSDNITTQKKKSTAKKAEVKEEPIQIKKEQEKPTEEDNAGVKTLEKDFLDKFIRYNELQLLMKDLPEIVTSFKDVQGFDDQLIRDTVEKLLTERQKEIDTLTKELTDLKEKITKEAEIANYKKSVIDVFNNQAKLDKNQSPYGYIEKSTNGDAFNNGETIAAQDGVPTTSISINTPAVEPIDNDNDPMMNAEQLPADEKPETIDDLAQSIEKNADALEIPVPPTIAKKKVKYPILIDSKKAKKSKKKS